MTTEPMLPARTIVKRYQAHGIHAKVYRDSVIVRLEAGWVGPFDLAALQETHVEDIERLEADARVAVVAVLCRNAAEWRKQVMYALAVELEMDLPYLDLVRMLSRHGTRRFSDPSMGLSGVDRLLRFGGWDEDRAVVYASVAVALHGRGELLRDMMD